MEPLAAWVEAERGRFILWLPVAMASGILIYFDLSSEPPIWLGLALLIPPLAALLVFWRNPAAKLVFALLLFAALGFARAEWRTALEPPLMTVPYGAISVTGKLVAIDLLPSGRRITLDPASLNDAPVARTIHVKLRNDDATALAPGAEIALRALLFKPERPAYPGAWDSGRDAFFSGLGASGFALGGITVTAPPKDDGIAVWLRGLREAIAANILHVLPVWRSISRYIGITAMLVGLLVYFGCRPPDVLISPDAKLIALAIQPGAGPSGANPSEIILFRQKKAASFIISQWQAVWNGASFTPADVLQCNTAFCRPPSRFNNIVVALIPPFTNCPDAMLVVSSKPLHGACSGRGRVVVDRFTVWRDGAVAAWVTPEIVRLQTDREVEGSRPWVVSWPASHWSDDN